MLNEQEVLKVIGRKQNLFSEDFEYHLPELTEKLNSAKVLVIGAAGSIGSATTKLIAKIAPDTLHLVDINENELADLVRQLRISDTLSSRTEFQTFVIDINSRSFEAFCNDGRAYDYIFNLSALKHVRSESNAYSLARMIETNIIATNRVIKNFSRFSKFKYFCVSTDKAANPVNLMGFSKLIMENYAFANTDNVPVSSARFANVAFSNGSLLQSFERRLQEKKPLVIPKDIERFFISEKEAGIICVLSGLLAPHRSILVPSEAAGLKLTSFEEIVTNYLHVKGYIPHFVTAEADLPKVEVESKKWPVFVSAVDTTGEKPFEEFVGANDQVSESSFTNLSIVQKEASSPDISIEEFERRFELLQSTTGSSKHSIINLLKNTGGNIEYFDVGKYLDDKL